MQAKATDLFSMTAGDLMTANVIQVPETMSLRAAAQQLSKERVSGAPVVNADGTCVGVISSADFLRLAARQHDVKQPTDLPLPKSCQYQEPHYDSAGTHRVRCTMPDGVCSAQVRQKTADGEDVLACNQPHCVFADWQVVEVEELPTDLVRVHMVRDPVTVTIDTPIQVVARRMIDASIHRLIVVDALFRPLGIVSGTDIVAAVSFAEKPVHIECAA